MKNILLWLCGYRKYTFTLFNGRIVSFHTLTRGQAIQKALRLEQRIRTNRKRTMDTLKNFHHETLSIPDELLQNVLDNKVIRPDRPANLAG